MLRHIARPLPSLSEALCRFRSLLLLLLLRASAATASGVPVAVLDSEYARATLKLREDIIQYAELVSE